MEKKRKKSCDRGGKTSSISMIVDDKAKLSGRKGNRSRQEEQENGERRQRTEKGSFKGRIQIQGLTRRKYTGTDSQSAKTNGGKPRTGEGQGRKKYVISADRASRKKVGPCSSYRVTTKSVLAVPNSMGPFKRRKTRGGCKRGKSLDEPIFGVVQNTSCRQGQDIP